MTISSMGRVAGQGANLAVSAARATVVVAQERQVLSVAQKALLFYRSHQTRIFDSITVGNGLRRLGTNLSEFIKKVSQRASKVVHSVKQSAASNGGLLSALNPTLWIVFASYGAWSVRTNLKAASQEESSEKATDLRFEAIASAGDAGLSAGAGSTAMIAAGWVTENATSFVTPLVAVSAVLSVARTVASARRIFRNVKALNKTESTFERSRIKHEIKSEMLKVLINTIVLATTIIFAVAPALVVPLAILGFTLGTLQLYSWYHNKYQPTEKPVEEMTEI